MCVQQLNHILCVKAAAGWFFEPFGLAFGEDTAQLILFVIDGLEGLTALDVNIARMLRKSKKDVILVVNKADFDDDKHGLC